MSEWIEEIYKEGLSFRLQLKQRLFKARSDFQTVEVAESTNHGRVLLNDGCFMLSERDEAIYHEMMAHTPLFVHPNPRSVLIVGGGDGGTAREVLRHRNIERVVMVEIDAMVIEACRKFIPKTASALSDPRLDLQIEDGVAYMAKSTEMFDVIMIDSTDPVGPAQPLFGEKFYSDVFARLNDDGIVIAQGESAFYEEEMQLKLAEITAKYFKYVSPYNFSNMTYPGGLWSFLWASKTKHPLNDLNISKVNQSGLEMFYYNENVHRAAFALPTFQRKQLEKWIKI
jgi:spermidine synthase